jgi:hypothetical protein
MATTNSGAGCVPAPDVMARRLAAQAEAALVDLEERYPAGMGAVEHALAERIRAALARLLSCSAQLAKDGMIVIGSTGQPRQHQLLKTEQELRREIADSLQTLGHQAEQRAAFERARALTSRRSRRSQEADATSTAKEPRQ